MKIMLLLLISFCFLTACTKTPKSLLLNNDNRIKAQGARIIIKEGYDKPDVDEVIPLLIDGLKSPHIGLQCNSALALGRLGKKSSEAVPELIKLLPNKHKGVRGNAALALGKIKSKLDLTIPALIEFSKNDKEAGWLGVEALGDIGTNAKQAIPYLKTRMSDDDENVMVYARNALRKITGDNHFSTTKQTFIVDGEDFIPIDTEIRNKQLQFINAIKNEDSEEVELLIKQGIDINCVDDLGRKALLFAIEKNNIRVIKILLDNGADPNASYSNRTALTLAKMKGVTEIINLLKKHGAKTAAELKAERKNGTSLRK